MHIKRFNTFFKIRMHFRVGAIPRLPYLMTGLYIFCLIYTLEIFPMSCIEKTFYYRETIPFIGSKLMAKSPSNDHDWLIS